jgi:hypothetical protein
MNDSAVDPRIRNLSGQEDFLIDRYSNKVALAVLFFGKRNILGMKLL